MSRSSYSVNNKANPSPLGDPDPYLIIEKSLEVNGQQWVENVNLIEELLVQIVNRLGRDYPQLKASFVVRRLPNFMLPYTNRNEYAVILDKFDFSLLPHDPTTPKPSTDKAGKPNYGQVEIFLPRKSGPIPPPPTPPNQHTDSKDGKRGEAETMEDCHVFLTPTKAYYSHEVFKAFATAFRKAADSILEDPSHDEQQQLSITSSEAGEKSGTAHLIGPHLLQDLKLNREVPKIFQVRVTPSSRLPSNFKERCRTTVNHLKSCISISYGETEVSLRPALFYEHGYHRVNANVTERIPLYHNGMLTIGESLLKGCLLLPTSFETLWTLQFWPSESHIVSLFHPSSVILRLFKMYGSFALNPGHFYETLNSNFLIGPLEDMEVLLPEDRSKLLPMDYLISSFLFELEEFSGIEDWAPRNFCTRLMHLFRSAIDSFEKGFHSHYFTKINVLRGIWRSSSDSLEREEESNGKVIFHELDDIRESPDDVEDYKDLNRARFLETDDLEDEFGLKFDELDLDEDDSYGGGKSPPKLTSDLVYNSSINPFESFDAGHAPNTSSGKGTTKSLSKLIGSGSNFLRRLGSRAGSESGGTVRNRSPPNTVRSMADVASEFEKSIASQRTRPSLFPFPISDNPQQLSSRQNLVPDGGDQKPGTSQQYDNVAFEGSVSASVYEEGGGKSDSIYNCILQCLKELPPPDLATDPDVRDYMDKMKRAMESQEELITCWGKVISEIPKPKFICPHAFTTRQIQYLARVIHIVSRCSPSTIKIVRSTKLPSWEISGDILRIVLHQMRSESSQAHPPNHIPPGELRPPPKKSSSFLITTRSLVPSRPIFKSFKRDPTSHPDPCKLHAHHHPLRYNNNGEGPHRELDPEEEMQLALEDPETAATNRLLQWLWQLRTSEIGRLSVRANKYLEELYQVSMANSHFLEQHAEERCFETLAVRSAVAVTKIMETGKFPPHIPLSTAAKKGWLWAEMVLSLASWNSDKGFQMTAIVPVVDDDQENGFILRDIVTPGTDAYPGAVGLDGGRGITTTTTKKKNPLEAEPDLDAVTLAFHSEFATPIGWNDIENPREPPGMLVPILIFSSLAYYKLWEVTPGNLVHALVRLQKFNTLQHVGNMLSHPHRKTALNEVRKLNKSTSFRIHHFENNIMSKTFKRLASIRTSRKKSNKGATTTTTMVLPPKNCLTCEQAGCSPERNGRSSSPQSNTVAVWTHGIEIECTKL